jgi:hypothetical protein
VGGEADATCAIWIVLAPRQRQSTVIVGICTSGVSCTGAPNLK